MHRRLTILVIAGFHGLLAPTAMAQRYHTPIDAPQQAEVDQFFSASVDGAFEHAGQTVLPPVETVPEDSETAMHASATGRAMDGVAGRQVAGFRPDRITDFEGTLGYETVFTPSIAPFKRVTVLSVVELAADGKTPLLSPRQGNFETLRLERPKANHDSFWGSVVLDFSEGLRVPLPSVAPQSRFLEARVSSPVALRMERDVNDVYFVSVEEKPAERIRFNYLMDAPQTYFARDLPSHRANLFARRVPPLPDEVRLQAKQVTDALGLSAGDSIAHVLTVLTGHFRAFVESREPPSATENIYVDLALGQKGVCRHRAYAFVITAQALGVHARFVMNEAHAWVEVEVEPGDWLRIDLGGAADGFDRRNFDERPQYQPAQADTLPRPSGYQASQEVAAASSLGSGGQRTSSEETTGSTSRSSGSGGAGARDASSGTEYARDQQDPTRSSQSDEPGSRVFQVTAEASSYRAFRGQTLTVRGYVRDASGRPAPASRLEARFAGSGPPAAVTLTQADGSFTIEVPIGIDADVGRRDLRLLVTPN